MPPRKGTKAYDQEYVYVLMGIHSETLEIMSVWQRRDGALSGPSGHLHHPYRGSRAESEAMLVYHLIESRTLPVHMYETNGDKVREELRQVADRIRAERAAKSE